MADDESTRMPAPDATVEPQKCCGTCRWLDIATGNRFGICNAPLPFWVWDDEVLDDLVADDMGNNCDTWQQRGAE